MSMREDIVATDELTVTLLQQALHVGRISPGALHGCAWPLLKSIFGSSVEGGDGEEDEREGAPHGFFSLTQEEDELTLVMDDRCRAAFAEASGASVEYAPHRWCAFELHLGSLAWEVPGLVCHLATLMAESQISILNLSSNDRDFLLVRETDVDSAKQVIQQRLQVCACREIKKSYARGAPLSCVLCSRAPIRSPSLAARRGWPQGGDFGEGDHSSLGYVLQCSRRLGSGGGLGGGAGQ